MPRNAMNNVGIDYCLPIADIASVLTRLASEPAVLEGVQPVTEEMGKEADVAELDLTTLHDSDRPGTPSGFACPDCGGSLWELREGELIRFRCRIGHAWSADSLLAEQSEQLETALWTALRALEEKASLARRLADQAQVRGYGRSAALFEEQMKDAEQHAALIRQVLMNLKPTSEEEEALNAKAREA